MKNNKKTSESRINELSLHAYLHEEIEKNNLDNITRTKAYEKFYFKHPEIKWAFLASMVSRNAGWNMTDLEGNWFRKALNQESRSLLFMTYERANWTIFYDAYPQLLVYEYSKHCKKPLFTLLPYFGVSQFMVEEWEYFWKHQKLNRLMTALIINEQNVIHQPVIKKKIYKQHVFGLAPYKLQDLFHFSTVIFPNLHGKLFGFSVHNFQSLTNRIDLGKQLGWLLFHSGLYHQFEAFAKTVPHTGSRYDYEQYFPEKKKRETPLLRMAYPIVLHSLDGKREDWFHGQSTKKWFKDKNIPRSYEVTDWFKHKQNQLHLLTLLQEYWRNG